MSSTRCLLIALLLAARGASAQESSLQHGGQNGLTLQAGVLNLFTLSRATHDLVVVTPALTLGGTAATGDRGEWTASATVLAPSTNQTSVGAALGVGYRIFTGEEEWKTFLSTELKLHAWPLFRLGARIGVGVQYDWSPNWGGYVEGAASGLLGSGIAFGFDGGVGVQARFF